MLLITLGLPGAGKGAIARKLKSFFNFQIVATGEILRDAIAEGNALGERVKDQVLAGDFIDDQLAFELVKDLLDSKMDIVMDGFPRNIAQAKALEDYLEHQGRRIDAVLFFDVDEEHMKQRLEGRRVCPNCHAVYHAINFPAKDGAHCDSCGTEITTRIDDTPENITHRVAGFNLSTASLLEYYEDLGLLNTIDADQSTMDMYYQVLETSQHFTNRNF